ncbi:LysM peptidoglycan-binding domain-containing protein [Candidatus Woesearchaeota archaeon]|nr:LysM peptidoglycan-binding domain-containing protein [Candidatus Woesearchaeota archaeon]
MDPETKKGIIKIAKLGALGTGLYFAGPSIGEGLLYGGAAISGIYLVNKVIFRNWKTTLATAGLLTAAYLISPLSKDLRQEVKTTWNNSILQENKELENTIDQKEQKIESLEDSIMLIDKTYKNKIDSINKTWSKKITQQKILENYALTQKQTNQELKQITRKIIEIDQKVQTNINKTEQVGLYITKQNSANEMNLKLQNSEPKYTKNSKESTNKKQETNTWYCVQPGDMLSKIARTYYGETTDYKEISELNKINNPNQIDIGQIIQLNPNKLITKQKLQTNKMPNKLLLLKKGESIQQYLELQNKNLDTDKTLRKIIDYNQNLGNLAVSTNPVKYNKQIIYIPD